MLIYVVQTGEYSDRHIVGLFTDITNAKRVSELSGGDVTEYWTDLAFKDSHPEMSFYTVQMDELGNGQSKRGIRKRDPYVDMRNVFEDDELKSIIDPQSLDCYDKYHHTYLFHMWARDRKHAVKIANERRVALIANNLWGKETGGI